MNIIGIRRQDEMECDLCRRCISKDKRKKNIIEVRFSCSENRNHAFKIGYSSYSYNSFHYN